MRLGTAASLGTLVGVASAPGAEPAATPESTVSGKRQFIWGNLVHLSMNMWCDWDAPELKGDDSIYRPELRVDRSLWNDLLRQM